MPTPYQRYSEIRESLDTQEVFDVLGIRFTEQSGDNWAAHCPHPDHGGEDSSPSFYLEINKLVWICFSCGEGNLPQLVMAIEDLASEAAAIDWLQGYSDYDNEMDTKFVERIARKLEEPVEEPWSPDPMPYYPDHLVEEWANNETDYFRERYISDSVRSRMRLGFDPAHTKVRKGETYTGPAAIIPLYVDGHLAGWKERWIDWGEGTPKWLGKYENTPDFPKRTTLFNHRGHGSAVVVEAELTAARLESAGVHAVATYGASVTSEQIELLRSIPHLILAPDNDSAGKEFTRLLIQHLDSYCELYVVEPVGAAKTDLGDIESDEDILVLIDNATSAFMLQNT